MPPASRLIAYASAYLKVHYPAAFYTALLNNQPMGFYHPATLVKDAQRRGVRFGPIDVQVSEWDCTVEEDGAIRLGLRYVSGLRAEAGKAIAKQKAAGTRRKEERTVCPKCGCDDASMIESEGGEPGAGAGSRKGTCLTMARTLQSFFCNVCSHQWVVSPTPPALPLRRRTGARGRAPARRSDGARRDRRAQQLGMDRRSALWQAERAVRPSGELFEDHRLPDDDPRSLNHPFSNRQCRNPNHQSRTIINRQ